MVSKQKLLKFVRSLSLNLLAFEQKKRERNFVAVGPVDKLAWLRGSSEGFLKFEVGAVQVTFSLLSRIFVE